MNILFVGSIYSEAIKEKLSKADLPTSSAGQTFENALINGLDKYSKIKIISEYYIPSYPRFKQFFLKSERFSHKDSDEKSDISVSFINLPILKMITQFISYIKNIRRLSKSVDAIIVYEVTSRLLLSTVLSSRGKKIVLIVPDLPEFMSDNKSVLYLMAKKFDRFLIDFALKYIDGFVLLSPYMVNKLTIGEKPIMILEGLFNQGNNDNGKKIAKEKEKILLYTGKIEKWFGLEDLLNAFSLIDGDQYRLWLCGPGDIDMVNRFSNNDPRIVYKGCLTHEDVLLYQKRVTLLVNPRHSADAFTMYSFPSKTMEYLASGTPTLMSPLKSLPEDYLEHLYLFEDESVSGMAKMIKECLNKSDEELYAFGVSASKFILENKNSFVQASRLIKFIKTI